ncbi:hypothetical protein OF83DRAFT_1177166 [Amylostereum chailletii]|nr:hypothetical protein OF83DRAFT_1177166 [Amylostereum chailletii]
MATVDVQKTLPVEILEHIVKDVLDARRRRFKLIANLSRAARQLRTIALRAYFSSITLESAERVRALENIPGVDVWARALRAPLHAVMDARLPTPLQAYRNLHTLALSCASFNIRSLPSKLLPLFSSPLPPTLRTLALVALPHITARVLDAIAHACPSLDALALSVVERLDSETCCWDCYEESESSILHSPVGQQYKDLSTLVTAYARALRPLQHLRHLSLGIFLSPQRVLADHIDLHTAKRQSWRTIGSPSADSVSAPQTPCPHGATPRPAKLGEYRWIGVDGPLAAGSGPFVFKPFPPAECVRCFETWSAQVRGDELLAAIGIAQELKRLETIRWSSWFSGRADKAEGGVDEEEVGWDGATDGRWTKVWVQRENGRVRVARKAWSE